MIISVNNHSKIPYADVLAAVRAVNRPYPHGHDYHWSSSGLPEAHVFTTLSEPSRESVPWLTSTNSQGETYLIDGVTVSNFVLPHYYNSMGESGGRNDFLRQEQGSSGRLYRYANPRVSGRSR